MRQTKRQEHMIQETANCLHVAFTAYKQTGERASFCLNDADCLPEHLLWTPFYAVKGTSVSAPLFCEVVDYMERCTKIPYVTPEELWQMVEGRQFRMEKTEGMLRPDEKLLNNHCSTKIRELLQDAIEREDTDFINEHTIPATRFRFVELV